MMPNDDAILDCFKDGITQSEIMLRGNCIRKWMFRYILKLRKKGTFSWALSFGHSVHKMLEEYYLYVKDNGVNPDYEVKVPVFELPPDVILNPAQYEENDYWGRVAQMLVQEHIKYYQKVESKYIINFTEMEIDHVYRGIRLRGILDLGFEESISKPRDHDLYLMDHKTCSDISDNLILGFQFRFQFLFYSWLVRQIEGKRPAGFLVNAIKKPKERRSIRNAESLEQFANRIHRNIRHEPTEYFRRIQIPLDDDTLQRFQDTILDPVITQFQDVEEILDSKSYVNNYHREALLIAANTDHCHSWNRSCEFLELCTNNLEDFAGEYIQDKIKHPELQR